MKREAVTHCLFSIVALVLGASSFGMEIPTPSLKKPNALVVTIDNSSGNKNYELFLENFPPDY